MIEKIKKFYANNRIWLYLLKYIFISLILSIFAILIDTRTIPLLFKIPSIFLTSVDLAKVILGTLAGALLTHKFDIDLLRKARYSIDID